MPYQMDKISQQLSGYKDVVDGAQPQRQTIICPRCKTTLDDFLDRGFVGCADCYNAFFSYAKELAQDVHGRANHIGKMPQREASKSFRQRELEKLIAEKDAAVKKEDYIKADQLKQQIDILRRGG